MTKSEASPSSVAHLSAEPGERIEEYMASSGEKAATTGTMISYV